MGYVLVYLPGESPSRWRLPRLRRATVDVHVTIPAPDEALLHLTGAVLPRPSRRALARHLVGAAEGDEAELAKAIRDASGLALVRIEDQQLAGSHVAPLELAAATRTGSPVVVVATPRARLQAPRGDLDIAR